MTSLSSTTWSSFSDCFFAPVSFAFWIFLVLLLVEIGPSAYEPLRGKESGSDEGESDEENHVRNTEWCQWNYSSEESTGDCFLSWTRCTIKCNVDSFDQFSGKT